MSSFFFEVKSKETSYFYTPNEKIGSGAFGKVYKAWRGENKNDIYALKEIDIPSSKFKGEQIKSISQQEIDQLNEINKEGSPHILKLYDVISKPKVIYLVTEYCEKGDLKKFLQNRPLSTLEALYEFSQILEGFKVLRKFKKIHRDIKPENILVKENRLIIADFQFAKTLKKQTHHTVNIGTPYYMAPEIIEGKGKKFIKKNLK
jgi:serine/threonine protein kinase